MKIKIIGGVDGRYEEYWTTAGDQRPWVDGMLETIDAEEAGSMYEDAVHHNLTHEDWSDRVELIDDDGNIVQSEELPAREMTKIINPENDQRLISLAVLAEEMDYEVARRELTITSRYHDWHDTVADRIMRELEDEDGNPDESLAGEYNDHIRVIITSTAMDVSSIDLSLPPAENIAAVEKNSATV